MAEDRNNETDFAPYRANVVSGAETDPLLWHMEGIDTAVGMEYAGQDVELYREILSDYADCIKEQAEAIEHAAAERNIENFIVEVHSLKSTSRTIGAMELSDMAKELEEYGKNRAWEEIAAKTPGILSAYRRLYSVIMPYLACDEEVREKKSVDREEVCRLLSDLATCLGEYDSIRAEEILGDLSVFDFTGDFIGYMEKLVSALNQFDYGTCKAIVSQWYREL